MRAQQLEAEHGESFESIVKAARDSGMNKSQVGRHLGYNTRASFHNVLTKRGLHDLFPDCIPRGSCKALKYADEDLFKALNSVKHSANFQERTGIAVGTISKRFGSWAKGKDAARVYFEEQT